MRAHLLRCHCSDSATVAFLSCIRFGMKYKLHFTEDSDPSSVLHVCRGACVPAHIREHVVAVASNCFFFCLFFAGLLKLNKNTKFSPLFYSIPCSCLVPGGVAECRIDIHCWYLPHRKIKQRALCVSGTHINYLCGSSTRDVYVQRHASCTWWGSKSHPTTAPALPLRAVHPERVKNERHQNRSKELLQSSCTVKLILIKIDYSIWATWVINF